MAVIGLVGYLLIRGRIPIPPVVLGLVLGPTLEQNYRIALILSEGKADIFYTSPVAILFFALAVLVIGLQAMSSLRGRKAMRTSATKAGERS